MDKTNVIDSKNDLGLRFLTKNIGPQKTAIITVHRPKFGILVIFYA